MAIDEPSASQRRNPDKGHDHHLPHSHGGGHGHAHDHGRPQLRLATTSGLTASTYAPGFSVLRASLFVRLGFALSAAILIWAAFHWATQ